MSTSPGTPEHPRASLSFTVTEEDTARQLGSGSLPVLGTPRLLAWVEAATCAALEQELGPEETSVGVRVVLDHVAPSAVGDRVRVTARVVVRDGRRRELAVEAVDDGGALLGRGEVRRVVVNGERFLQRRQR